MILLSLPFVPGVELGLILMLLFGREGILLVYLATVGGLMLSYYIGKNLPENWIIKIINRVGIVHYREDRSVWLEEMLKRPKLGRSLLKHRAGSLLLRYRYLLLAVLFNLPGNSITGGGGGISILAGASYVYRAKWFLLTAVLATMPIPLLVYIGLIQLENLF